MRISLSYEEFQFVLAKLFDLPVLYDVWLRVEKALKRDFVKVEAIRVYLPELRKEIDQTVESGEAPELLIKRTVRQKTGKSEIEIVFMGSSRDRHVEDLRYYQKNPDKWRTWGLIVLTLEQAEKLFKVLQEMFGIVTLD